jgi:hypothetical protein
MNFGPFQRIITSSKVQVAAVAALAAGLALFNVQPERRAEVLTFATGIFGLAAAIVLATGYEDGKQKEGTVPEGSVPASPPASPVNVNIGAPDPSASPAPAPGTETTTVSATSTKTVPVADAAGDAPH